MNRWVSYLLLVSIVRLQLVCCCGSIVHLDLVDEVSAVKEHSHCDSRGHSDGSACCSSKTELPSLPTVCFELCHHGSGCDHDNEGSHHHHLHVLHAAIMPSPPYGSVERVALSALDPLVDMAIGVEFKQTPAMSLSSWQRQFLNGISILTLFGHLRI